MLTHPVTGAAYRPANLLIGLSLALTGWQLMAGSIPLPAQWLIFTGLLFGAGIPHGALDHLVSRQTAQRLGKPFSWVRFIAGYVLLMAAYGLLWALFPSLSLAFFLVGSAWHFGETDIERVPASFLWTLTRLAAGVLVISFILLVHANEVTPILARITRYDTLTASIWQTAVSHTQLLLMGNMLLVSGLLGLSIRANPVAVDWLRLAQLVVILAVGACLPLLLSFGLYFGGWHALSSFQAIGGYLKPEGPARSTSQQIWLRAVPFTALSLAGLLLFFGWWHLSTRLWDPLPLLFIFLSVITLPHLFALHGMRTQLDR